MFVVIGIAFGIICTFTGFLLHGGSMMVFVAAWTEFIVIIGAAIGIFIGSNGMAGTKQALTACVHLLKSDPYTRESYLDLLIMLYKVFSISRTEGMLVLESHLEEPEKSSILSTNHSFLHNHHARDFFCDTMKVVVTGGVEPHQLAELMDADLESSHASEARAPDAMQAIADALPAVGIVACVLGIIVTMGHIGGAASEIGMAIGNALVGTFLGVMVAYVVVNPVVKALQLRNGSAGQYLSCIRNAIECGARGEPPMNAVEFARRNIDPEVRPTFAEVNKAVKERGKVK